ncbi:uncharacterized protein LOC124111057 isoform X5 [Haliotis rufescens]|uniref:uncharacterized protein LOC124111057 isoform X5 n=1 Tax=Haliotis rufescens TaxID=6454 RepID=UPI00201ED2C2|nr:uncharacterized protein LOC124111057 isoform X5 [Haliotis rufescens]
MTGIFVSVLVSVLFASSVGAIPNEDLERYFKDMRKDVMHKLDGLEKSNKNLLNKLQEVEDAVSHEAEKQSKQEISFPSNQASLNKGKPGKTKRGGESETPHHENATSPQSLRTRKNQFVKSPTSGRNSRVLFRKMTSRKGNDQFAKSPTSGEVGRGLFRMVTSGKGNDQFAKSPTSGEVGRGLFRMVTSGKGNDQFAKSPTSGEVGRGLFRMVTSGKGNDQFAKSPTSGEVGRGLFRMVTSGKGNDQFAKSPTSGEVGRGLFRMVTSGKGNGNHGMSASSLAGGPVRRSKGPP